MATISVSWIWFVFLAILGRITGKIDKSGKYIVILNKVSSVIVIIVGLIILKNIVGIFKLELRQTDGCITRKALFKIGQCFTCYNVSVLF